MPLLWAVRTAAWLLALAIVVLSLVPPTLRPETGVPHHGEHFAIFAAMGAAFALAYRIRSELLAVLLTIFTGTIEITQTLVPGRHARLSDFIVDTLAACIGLLAARSARHALT